MEKMELSPTALKVIHLYMKDPVAARTKVNAIFWELIHQFGTQKEVAKRLKLIRQTFNYRFNHGKTIHLEDVLLMLKLLESNRTEKENWIEFIDALSISERARLAKKEWDKLGSRQGQKNQKNASEKEVLRHTYDEVIGRTDDYLAKKYGFKSRFSLYAAIAVVEQGCPELIAAIDQEKLQEGAFKIHLAAKVASLSKELQRELLLKGIKAIRRYFKKTEEDETKTFNMDKAMNNIQIQLQQLKLKASLRSSLTHLIQNALYHAYE